MKHYHQLSAVTQHQKCINVSNFPISIHKVTYWILIEWGSYFKRSFSYFWPSTFSTVSKEVRTTLCSLKCLRLIVQSHHEVVVVQGMVICSAPCCCMAVSMPTWRHQITYCKSGYLWMGSWTCTSQCCEAKLTDYIFAISVPSWFRPLLACCHVLFMSIKSGLHTNHTSDIVLSLCVSLSVLCFVTRLLRVKHPNILQLVDVFETKKEYFLFLELWV